MQNRAELDAAGGLHRKVAEAARAEAGPRGAGAEAACAVGEGARAVRTDGARDEGKAVQPAALQGEGGDAQEAADARGEACAPERASARRRRRGRRHSALSHGPRGRQQGEGPLQHDQAEAQGEGRQVAGAPPQGPSRPRGRGLQGLQERKTPQCALASSSSFPPPTHQLPSQRTRGREW